VTVQEALDKLDGGGVVNPADITDLISKTPSSMHVEHYAGIVADSYRLRSLMELASGIVDKVGKGEDASKVSAWAMEALVGNGNRKKEVRDLSTILDSVLDTIEDRVNAREEGRQVGVQVGLRDLDKILNGIRGGDLVYLAGRPGMGKTTAALQFATEIARNAGPVLIRSAEMSDEELVLKLLASASGCNYSELRSGFVHDEDWPILLEAANELFSLPIGFLPPGNFNDMINDIRTRVMQGTRPAAIVIDYLQLLVEPGRGSRNDDVTDLSRRLKLLAQELDTPIICLSQLSRAVESRGDKRPQLSDLRDSGSLEQDADFVIFVYREAYYKPEDPDCQGILDFIVAKNRHGSTRTASTFFRPETGVIRDLQLVRESLEY
jgi:replicative DNA helicase